MTKRKIHACLAAVLLFGGAAALSGIAPGCQDRSPSVIGSPPAGGGQEYSGPNAYDVVKMCRISDEEGPVYFAHAAHADLVDVRGGMISCGRCHHEIRTKPGLTPRACNKCHLQHDHYEARDILTM